MERCDRIAAALRIRLLAGDPFMGYVLLRLCCIHYVSITDTAATDGMNILINPEYIDGLEDDEIIFLLLHEMYHVVLEHRYRFMLGMYEQERWNVACDYVVNFQLLQRKAEFEAMSVYFNVPENILLFRDSYGRVVDISDKSAEDIYEELPEIVDYPEIALRDDVTCYLPEPLPKCVMHREIKNLFAEMKMAGYSTDDIQIMGYFRTQFTKTRTKWYVYLRRMFVETCAEEDSYDTPNRKYIPYGLILPGPGKNKDALDSLILFIDVSGSMTEDALTSILNEAFTLSCEFEVKLSVVFWDTRICGINMNVTKKTLYDMQLPKGGGTDINCVYQFIAERKLKTSAFVVFTDGLFSIPNLQQYFKQWRKVKQKTLIALTESKRARLEELGTLVAI